ncbi:MAG: hypothetical protein Tsb002_13160 [Wenzhouxiangellaceae bacterium]
MKKASRFMPKYQPEKPNILFLLVFLGIALVILIYHPWYFVAFVGIIILVIVSGIIDHFKTEKYFAEICKDRDGLSICEFAREFDPKIVDTWIIRAVYEQLQDALPTTMRVPVMASDNLVDTLMIDNEDLELGLIIEVAQRTGRSIEDCEHNPYYSKVTTARNLVLFFNHQARINAA